MKYKAGISNELERWYAVLPIDCPKNNTTKLILLLKLLPEFRSVIYFRCRTSNYNPLRLFYPPMSNLFIPTSSKIGSGLIIQHGFSSILNCEEMGDNCQVWQNVTIGKSKSGRFEPRPKIGCNVKITAHAVVIGDITIGDNAIIGAGAVVTKSVPANATVVGNPAKIIRLNGQRVDIAL